MSDVTKHIRSTASLSNVRFYLIDQQRYPEAVHVMTSLHASRIITLDEHFFQSSLYAIHAKTAALVQSVKSISQT